MPDPLIHGLVMARDEWPLLGVSITHALVHHVDRVHVLDHGSRDGTAAGLARLRREWGDRITVTRLGDGPFLQEAAMLLLREIVAPSPDDWIYAFDADEFGITAPGVGLRDVVADVDRRHEAVRYEVHNWVAPADFSTADPSRYAELRFRAVPPAFLSPPPDILADEIAAGSLNFFDVPFGSKVLVRGSAAGWITAGSHAVAGSELDEAILPPSTFRAGHLPFLERARIDTRVAQGRALRDVGLPVAHGWQSQLLLRVAAAGGLDDFWARHSLGARTSDDGPVVVRDDALAAALAPTLPHVPAAGATPGGEPSTPATDAEIVPAALRTIRRLQVLADDLRRQRDAALAAAGNAPTTPRSDDAAEGRPAWRIARRLAFLLAQPFTPSTDHSGPRPATRSGPDSAVTLRVIDPDVECLPPERAGRASG